MNELDDRLRAALRRTAPPAGFADRVARYAAGRQLLQQQQADPAPVRQARPKRTFVRFAAAAAFVGALGAGIQYRSVLQEREERARAEAAIQQVVQALRLAGGMLHVVQTKVKETGS